MWAEETKDGKTKFREQYKDPLTGKYRKVSVTYDKNTNQTRRKAQIALERKIEYKCYSRSNYRRMGANLQKASSIWYVLFMVIL